MRSVTSFQRFEQEVHKPSFAVLFVVLRVLIGLQFLLAGIAKLGDWSAEGYLLAATGPFANVFHSMAGNGFVDVLNVAGQIAVGAALILGLCVRPASFFGAIMILLYYFAHFEQNTVNGLVEYHLIYFVLFCLFLAGGAGRLFGLDGIAARLFKRRKNVVAILFG